MKNYGYNFKKVKLKNQKKNLVFQECIQRNVKKEKNVNWDQENAGGSIL